MKIKTLCKLTTLRKLLVLSTIVTALGVFAPVAISVVTLTLWFYLLIYSFFIVVFTDGGYKLCSLTEFIYRRIVYTFEKGFPMLALWLGLSSAMLSVFALSVIVSVYCTVYMNLH